MFMGEYEPRLDTKGRIILPAKLRERLAGGIVITRGQERCLYMFPRATFEQMYADLQQAPLTMRDARNFVRVMMSGAAEEIPDKQGRITIPAQLRKYANLERDLAVIGAGSRVEIWDRTAWDEFLTAQEDVYADTAGEVVPGLI